MELGPLTPALSLRAAERGEGRGPERGLGGALRFGVRDQAIRPFMISGPRAFDGTMGSPAQCLR
jgi:hypothetical protein